jgi:hypothetical protein
MLFASFFAIGKISVVSASSCTNTGEMCISTESCSGSGVTIRGDGECKSGYICCKNTSSSGSGVYIPTKAETGLSDKTVVQILTKFLNWLLEIVGIIAIMGFVISGIMYLVSAGNEEMITKAKKYMMYCLIGIIVALASFVVIKTIDSILNATIGT